MSQSQQPVLPCLTLYTRQGCHLCEQAEIALDNGGWNYKAVDVDEVSEWQALYGDDVPVLCLTNPDGKEERLLRGVMSSARLSSLKLVLIRRFSEI